MLCCCCSTPSFVSLGGDRLHVTFERGEKRREITQSTSLASILAVNEPYEPCRPFSGSILPDDTLKMSFVFKSKEPGIFTERWQFLTRPILCGGRPIIFTLRGIASEEDIHRETRAEIEVSRSSEATSRHYNGISSSKHCVTRRRRASFDRSWPIFSTMCEHRNELDRPRASIGLNRNNFNTTIPT